MRIPLFAATASLLALPVLATPSHRTPQAPTPSQRLANAIRLNDLGKALQLLDRGAAVNTRASDGRTVLMLAAARGNVPALERIKSRGAKLDLQDDRGRTALIHSTMQTDAMIFLLESGADPTIKDRRGADVSHHFGRVCAIRERAIKKGLGSEPARLPLILDIDAPPLLPVPPELQQLQ